MDIPEYIQTRVDNQIEWYDKKSISCQKKYKIAQVIKIILATLIPLLSSYSKNNWVIAIIIGIFGAGIAIAESLSKLNKWHENWIEYRATCELLLYQKYLYITKSSPYDSRLDNIDNIFIHNIENIISSENNKWKVINTKKEYS